MPTAHSAPLNNVRFNFNKRKKTMQPTQAPLHHFTSKPLSRIKEPCLEFTRDRQGDSFKDPKYSGVQMQCIFNEKRPGSSGSLVVIAVGARGPD
jgi:hypothetical protein